MDIGKAAFKEFVRRHLVIERVKGNFRFPPFKENQNVITILYLVFAKVPEHESIRNEDLDSLLKEFELKETGQETLLAGFIESFRKLLKEYGLAERFKILPGRPLGALKVVVYPLSSAYNWLILNTARSSGIADKELIAEILTNFPLDFVSTRHRDRGVGGKAIEFVLEDLKKSYIVTWVYINARPHAREILKTKKYGFSEEGIPRGHFVYRKL